MPQMAPLMWLSLFIFFLTIYLLFNIINYFSFIITNNKKESMKKIYNLTMPWKW